MSQLASKRFVIYAPGVNSGGGKLLLTSLIDKFPEEVDSIFILDSRINSASENFKNKKFIFFKSSIFGRIYTEFRMWLDSKPSDITLCLGNIPPFIKPKGKKFIFCQNKFVLDKSPIAIFSLKRSTSILIQRLLFWSLLDSEEHIVVQSKTMFNLLQNSFCKPDISRCHILPFIFWDENNLVGTRNRKKSSLRNRFIYVASGDPHKNHSRLIEAWVLLSLEGIYPLLYLTIDEKIYPELCELINSKKDKFNLNVENLGSLPHSYIMNMYCKVDALIFPSLVESYGLPLIEARVKGLSIIASELDFVRDVVSPDQTFDPLSPLSISRSIQRFMGVECQDFETLSPEGFILTINSIANGS